MRVTALGTLVWLSLGMWAPSAASAVPMNWSVSLPNLRALLLGSPTPRVPRQQGGSAAGLAHYVPASATRAGRGAGRAPGKGKGQLPAYHPYVRSRKTFTTGPGVLTGFNAHTSKRVASAATATSDLYKNADGTYTNFVYDGPVNYQSRSGVYEPISTVLVAGQGGRWQEKANSLSLNFAPHANAPDLASLGLPSGQSYSFGLAGAAAATGVASGATVTYPGVLPGTDLTESATPIGLKESLVLHSASAPSTWTFPLHLSGLSAVMAADGSVDLVNRAGKAVVVIPHGYATDSAYNPQSGNPARTEAVTYQLVTSASGQVLQVSLSKAWLDDPARVFPVTVDPSGNWGASGSTYVLYPYTNDYSSDALMQVGTWDSGTNMARSFYHFWCLTNCTRSLVDYHITKATLNIFDAWAYTCTAEPFEAYAVSEYWSNTGNKSWAGPSLDWNAELGSLTEDPGAACPSSTHTSASASVGKWMSMPVSTAVMNDWTLGILANNGISVTASESNSYQYKQFDGCNSPNPPYFAITYSPDTPPQINSQFPPDNYSATTLTPELQASGSDADNWPDPLTYRFTVENSSSTVVAQSGWQSSPDWTVPSGKLAWNQTYYWYAQDYDGLDYSTVSVNALSTPVPQPLITSALSQNSGGKGFDPANNNYTASVTDAQVSVVGPALAITRDYNSEDLRTSGAFGAGWSSMLGMRVSPGLVNSSGAEETAVVTYPDGQQVGFGVNSGSTSLTPPQGRFATLVSVSGGYSLTDKNDTVYTFTQNLGSGVYGITSITDAVGHALNFTWNSSGQITTITSAASGRALHVTWATPSGASHAHVATVSTDPVTSGDASTALTWAYGYTGDQLTSVCPPGTTTACTDYSYTAGTGYPGAVLDSGPHSYWPLDEASGTTAASAVLVNEGADNGAYTNVALGQPGPLAGSSATSAGFNGSSSYVSLPDNLVSGATYQSVSLWFKTSSAGQVLFSYSKSPITDSTTPGSYTPELYVGSSGYLYGEFWDGSAKSPVKSTAVVNDGKWHQAVLVSGITSSGTTEELYVDGVADGGLTGTVKNTSQEYDYVGAGFIGGGWPDEPHHEQNGNTGYATFFNGDIAGVGFWNRPLTSVEVTVMYRAGTSQASLLTKTTRPTGSAYAQVAYNPGTGAVTQVTDDSSGVWKVGAPADSGSSQVYVSSVLGAGPADYWRFTGTGTTQPANQVNGGTATNSNVTEGVAGPFADATAYSFNGTSSYTALPSGLVTGKGNQSVSLWFKTTGKGEVLFSSSADPITNGTTPGSYTPELYIGDSGDLHAEFWNGSTSTFTSSFAVNNGAWHNVVLAAGTSSQAVYLDGKLLGTLSGTISGTGQHNVYVGAGFVGGGWPDEPHHEQSGNTGYASYFNGSVAEVAFYNSQLAAGQVAAEYNASKYSSGLTPVQTVHVTDPGGKTITYVMDPLHGNRLVSQTDALGNTTRYGYDTRGFLYDVVDPNGNETITGRDVRGNAVSETTCQDQAANECSTAYYTYYPDDTSSQLSPNAENDLLLTARGPGSASSSDTTYLTSYGYNSYGEQTAVTTPPVAGFSSGRTTATTYTTSTTAAVGGGDTPAGLPETVTTPGGAVTTTRYYSNGDVAQVTDPDGLVTTYTYDGIGRLLTETVISKSFPNGLTTTYAYNQVGEVVTETDPPVTDRVTGAVRTPQITTTYDADGDVLSQTTADLTGGDASRTVTNTYNSHDQLVSSTDPAGAKTTYTYDVYGNLASQTDPAGHVTGYAYGPDGHLLTVTLENYTGNPNNPQSAAPLVESSRAYDPAGRLASVTNAMGFTTSYTYTDDGLVATVTRSDPGTGASFTEQSNTYNGAGQLVQQVTSNGATTTGYTVDAAGRVTSQTVDPSGLDRTTAYSYSPDNYVADKTLTGPGSSTPVQSTSYAYDPMGNMTSRSVSLTGAGGPVGWWRLDQTSGTSVPDASGTGFTGTASNVTWSGGVGVFNGSSSQVLTRGPVLDATGSFTVSAWVNLNTTAGSQTMVSQQANVDSAFYLKYANGAWQFARPVTDSTSPSWDIAAQSSSAVTGTWTMLTGVYDAATGAMTLYVNGAAHGTATDTTPFAADGPLTIGRTKYQNSAVDFVNGSISDVRVYQRALSASQVQGLYTNGRDGGADASNTLTTTWTLGERGLPTSVTGPDGNTTYYSYDAAGQLAVTTGPVVSTQVYGGTATQVAPVTMTGYDTFGEPVEASDANGNVTVTAYDADGRPVSVTQPGYTPPASSTPITAVTTASYNNLGEVTSQTDPLGNKTTYTYDQLGDVASVTAPDGGVTTYAYDTNGDQLSATGPTGATVAATYDYLGRPVTSTQVERYPSAAAYTTTSAYGTGGWLASQTTPDRVKTSYSYDAAGETTSVTDGAGNTTSYSYNPAGQQTAVTYPDGTGHTTTYDEAGRPVDQADLNASGSVLRSESAAYDANGNLLSSTDYRGNTTSYTYNPAGWLASETQPVTATSGITTSFGYDAAGNHTLYVDGNANTWWTTYNSWNLPQSQIEPPTSAYPSAADGTFTTAYDANGNPVTLTKPGGVTLTSTYNNMGELTGQTGSGADAPTATRSFGYDLAGNLTSASTSAVGSQSATSESLTYNDRGLVLSAAGTAGSSSFAYNGDGQPVSVTDAAGTTSYTYDSAGRPATLTDPLTGTTATYTYNPVSQVSQISYGTGNDVRKFGYNSLHQLTSNTLATAAGQTVASATYGYDPNGNLTSKATTGFAGSSASTYTYDEANRLTSWNNGAATVNYAYDGAGNRTTAGSQTFTYDARDELTSNGTSSYSYTAQGTLSSVTGPSGTQSFTSDAYGQSITQAGLSYGYDALGRPVSVAGTADGTIALSYAGPGNTLASDGTWAYTWGPGGTTLAGIGPVGGGPSAGVLAFTDAHTDVTGDFSPAGTTLVGSATYDPWGQVTASSGLVGNLGYQSGWAAPGSGLVHMGARWYSPSAGQFTSRDSVSVNPVPASAAANPFAYVGDNPLTATDPTGHMFVGGGGGYCSVSCQTSHLFSALLRRSAPPRPRQPSCGGFLGCLVHRGWHDLRAFTSNGYHRLHNWTVDVVRGAQVGLNYLRRVGRAGLAAIGHAAHNVRTAVQDMARYGAHVAVHTWRATVSAGAAAVHTVTRYASRTYHRAVHVVKSVYHSAARAATATVRFVKHHAAAIASVVVSVAVFAGCEAVLGGATIEAGGIGAVAGAAECGSLAGAAGNAVSYGITAAQTGKFSWSGLARATASGALTGAATGFAGGALAEGASAAGGLLARGAATSAADAAATAAATGADATATAAVSDSATAVAQDNGNWLNRLLAPKATAYAHTAPEDARALTAAPERLALTAGRAPPAIAPARGASIAAWADVSSAPNTAFLWTGMAEPEASAVARAMGGDTLESTLQGRGIAMPPFVKGDPASEEGWQLVSARWAAGLSGRVRVLVGPSGIRSDSVVSTIEVPIAEANPLVTSIEYIYLSK